MGITEFAAILAIGLLGVLSLFQVSLIAGAPLGEFAWGGAQRTLPAKLRFASVGSIGIYALIAAFVLQRVGALEYFPSDTVSVSLWVIATYFFLGIGLNAISKSHKERLVMVPIATVLAVCFLVLAW